MANCQVGVFLGYPSGRGHSFLGGRLYLPRDWAGDVQCRVDGHVPNIVAFKTNWELAWEMYLEVRRSGVPHAWVTGDEDFGEVHALPDLLQVYGQSYVFEVASPTVVYGGPPCFR